MRADASPWTARIADGIRPRRVASAGAMIPVVIVLVLLVALVATDSTSGGSDAS